MPKRKTVLTIAGAIVLAAIVATPLVLIPGQPAPTAAPAPAVADGEQAATIDAMRPPKRERPVIAVVTWNKATEVSDFLSIYSVLKRSDVADVVVVAEKDEPVQLYYSKLRVEPESTMAAFDAEYPEGADYLVVPAMDPGNDPFIARWIREQQAKGATIVGVCNGVRMLSTAGVLDGHRATGHWSAIAELRAKHPTMEYVPDRRYVADDGVVTSTGITANIPVMIALVEAIGGREAAQRVADDLGVTNWDARHDSSAFKLTPEHMKTFVRNALTIWRHETIGIPVEDGVDEVALGFLIDAYSRSQLGKVITLSPGGAAVRSKHGLTLLPEAAPETAQVSTMLAPPPDTAPAALLETELPKIAERYDLPTAAIVTLVMEYPWKTAQVAAADR